MLPITLGAKFNQDKHLQTTGFSMQTDNNVSFIKNMFIIEFTYRFSKREKVKKKQKDIIQESEGAGGGLL